MHSLLAGRRRVGGAACSSEGAPLGLSLGAASVVALQPGVGGRHLVGVLFVRVAERLQQARAGVAHALGHRARLEALQRGVALQQVPAYTAAGSGGGSVQGLGR